VNVATVPAREEARDSLLHRIVGPPRTSTGRRAAWLVGGVIALLAGVGGLVAAGAADLGWAVYLPLVLASAAGVVAAIVAGGMAVTAVARGERSIIVLGPLLFGAVCLVWVVGLVLQPTS
jgi:hypothetical protein